MYLAPCGSDSVAPVAVGALAHCPGVDPWEVTMNRSPAPTAVVRQARKFTEGDAPRGCTALGALRVMAIAMALGVFASWPGARLARAQERTDLNATLRRIFATSEFDAKRFGPARWLKGVEAYVTVEPSAAVKSASDIVRYETASGKRDVLVSASQLIPPGAKTPLKIEDYSWSDDMN